MKRNYAIGILWATLASAALAGCGESVRKELGLAGEGPDEFAIVSRKPLEIPADRNTLATPRPGAKSIVEYDPQSDAG